MLGHAVKRRLGVDGEIYDRQILRKEGVGPVWEAMSEPCVLVAGAQDWDPLEWFVQHEIPVSVPKVAIVAQASRPVALRALPLGVRVLVPAGLPKISVVIAVACRLAWASRGALPRLTLVEPDRPDQATRRRGRAQ